MNRLGAAAWIRGVALVLAGVAVPALLGRSRKPPPLPLELRGQLSPTAAPSPDDPASPPSDAADPESMFPHFKSTRFWLSGQANFIFQAHPDFHADYSGPHSLGPRL